MMVEIDGVDLVALLEFAAFAGIGLLLLLAGLAVWLLVRPPRHVREARRLTDQENPVELGRAMDRMEARLETLERLLGDRQVSQSDIQDRILEPAEGPESGRNI